MPSLQLSTRKVRPDPSFRSVTPGDPDCPLVIFRNCFLLFPLRTKLPRDIRAETFFHRFLLFVGCDSSDRNVSGNSPFPSVLPGFDPGSVLPFPELVPSDCEQVPACAFPSSGKFPLNRSPLFPFRHRAQPFNEHLAVADV